MRVARRPTSSAQPAGGPVSPRPPRVQLATVIDAIATLSAVGVLIVLGIDLPWPRLLPPPFRGLDAFRGLSLFAALKALGSGAVICERWAASDRASRAVTTRAPARRGRRLPPPMAWILRALLLFALPVASLGLQGLHATVAPQEVLIVAAVTCAAIGAAIHSVVYWLGPWHWEIRPPLSERPPNGH